MSSADAPRRPRAPPTDGFNLAGLAAYKGGGGSKWMKVLPAMGDFPDALPMHPMVRACLARQLLKEMKKEGIVKDPDMREAVAALNMMSGALTLNPIKVLSNNDMKSLIKNRIEGKPIVGSDIAVDLTINLLSLPFLSEHFGAPEENLTINSERFQAWYDSITPATVAAEGANAQPAVNTVVRNIPSPYPAGIEPVPEEHEIHPWMFGGYIDKDISTGLIIAEATGSDPAIQCLLSALVSLSPGANVLRAGAINLLALGTTIITSGGNITSGRIRKIITTTQRETLVDTIDFTRDQVLKGWDFLSVNWVTETRGAANFHRMFLSLENSVKGISLRLALMCQQTEFKMLTGVIVTCEAMRGFRDFPWDDLFTYILVITGDDEFQNLSDYLHLVFADERAKTGHWLGWTYALREAVQGKMKIACYKNLLYAALQLTIQVGGNQAMRNYQGLENHTVQCRGVIDDWVVKYATQRTNAAPAFELVGPEAVVSPRLTAVRNFRM